jgi:ABC-type nitrate/sulfonate/bicarbonate transport system substrate-binding protein
MKLKIFCLSTLLILSIILSSCASQITDENQTVRLKLNWHHGVQFLGFYIAQEKGFYEAQGLDVTIEPKLETDQAIPEHVAAGDYDFSAGGAIQRAQSGGTEVTVIASIFQFGPETLFAKADSGIQTPADLAGHSVVVKAPGWERLIDELLTREGMSMDDITPANGGYDMTPFYEGEVDVWAGYINDEVIRARMEGYDLVTIPFFEYGISSSALTLLTSQSIITENPDLAVRFLRATLQGWQWAIENPEEAVDIMLEKFPELAEDRDFHLASFDASIPLISPPGVQIGAIDCEAWIAHDLLQDFEIKDQLCTTEILNEAIRE